MSELPRPKLGEILGYLVVMIVGAFIFYQSLPNDSAVTCDGKEMTRSDVCSSSQGSRNAITGGAVGASYEEMADEQHAANPGLLALGAGLVLLGALPMVLLLRSASRTSKAATRQNDEADRRRVGEDLILRRWITAAQSGDPHASARMLEVLRAAGHSGTDLVVSVPELRRLGIGAEHFGGSPPP